MSTCPRCGHANDEADVFCQECGASLVSSPEDDPSAVRCPACDAQNPLGTSFCRECGGRLSGGAAAANDSGPSLGEDESTMQPGASTAPRRKGGGPRLVAVRRDGSDGPSYDVDSDQFDIGRSDGDLLFDDPHMGPRHARIALHNGQYLIQPLENRNGVYVRLRQPQEIFDGDMLLLGKQVLKFEIPPEVEQNPSPAVEHDVVLFGTPAAPPWGRLRQMTSAGTTRDVFHLTRQEITMGRELGDIIFGDDEFLSRRHAQLHIRANRVTLSDLGSSNGTFVRLRGPHLLMDGEQIRMGDELLRFELG